jgi:hypothetical protein
MHKKREAKKRKQQVVRIYIPPLNETRLPLMIRSG